MSPAALSLISVYEEWRRESLSEGAAISVADWPEVATIQARKGILRRRIESGGLSPEVQGFTGEDEQLIRAYVAELIGLERANDTALAAKRRESEDEKSRLESATGNLRRVQRYGKAPESAWAAYS